MDKKRINIYLREKTYILLKDHVELEGFDMSTCVDILLLQQLNYLEEAKKKAVKEVAKEDKNTLKNFLGSYDKVSLFRVVMWNDHSDEDKWNEVAYTREESFNKYRFWLNWKVESIETPKYKALGGDEYIRVRIKQ